MAAELLQDAIVTAVALAAGTIVARRVFGFVTIRDDGGAGCDKCASGPASARTASSAAAAGRPDGQAATVHPLIVVRRSTSNRSISA